MIGNFYVTHAFLLLGAIGAAVGITPESRGHVIGRAKLLLPGWLAVGGALALIVYPDIVQLLRPELWTILIGAILVGAVRGRFIGKDSDLVCHLVRMTPARDGRWAASLLVLLAILEIAVELFTPPNDHTYLPTMEFGAILPAGYLFGRATMAWIHSAQLQHVDLGDP